VPLNYGRAKTSANVLIDESRCTNCGLCVKACRGAPLVMREGKLCVDQTRLFGCIGCGQCVAVCPRECITVQGRDMTPADVLSLPVASEQSSYAQLYALLLCRRSVRDFQPREVEPVVIEKLIESASTAPMGVPPSEVGVLVFAGRPKVQAFRADLVQAIRALEWLVSPAWLAVSRLFTHKEAYAALKEFLTPVLNVYLGRAKELTGEDNKDWFLYDAPLLLYFYGTPYADAPDPIIAATYAMLAGHSLGLGTCMLGIPGMLFQFDKKLRDKYQVPERLKPGVVVAFGYPAFRYHRAVRRRFARVEQV